MGEYLFNQKSAQRDLQNFFKKEKSKITSFGTTVNQTFEAFVFAAVIKWYQRKGYDVEIKNPKIDGQEVFRLKFSTRGAPKKYSFAKIYKEDFSLQLRHQLRVSTKYYKNNQQYRANICCDIAIIKDVDLIDFGTDDPIPNDWLITFGEVKHMSAFAELVANFVGLAHELTPSRLRKTRTRTYDTEDIPPFLYVSGLMNPTAKGILESIESRKFDIDVYCFDNPIPS